MSLFSRGAGLKKHEFPAPFEEPLMCGFRNGASCLSAVGWPPEAPLLWKCWLRNGASFLSAVSFPPASHLLSRCGRGEGASFLSAV